MTSLAPGSEATGGEGSALLVKPLGLPRVSVGHLVEARAGSRAWGGAGAGHCQTLVPPMEFLTVP